MRIGRACHGAVQCHTLHAMVHEGIAHGTDGGGTRMDNMCCIMIDRNHCHRFACSVMLQLGSRAPIVIKWPAVVLVIWPHFNGNAQRRPRSAHSILTLTLLHLLTFLKSDTFAPSRWDRQDSGHMTAALPICRLDARQFDRTTRRWQSGGLRGAFLHGFRKASWRSADCPA